MSCSYLKVEVEQPAAGRYSAVRICVLPQRMTVLPDLPVVCPLDHRRLKPTHNGKTNALPSTTIQALF